MSSRIAEMVDAAPREHPFLEDARSSRVVGYGQLADALHGGVAWFAAQPSCARVALDIEDPLDLAITHLSVIAAGRLCAPLDPFAPAADRNRAVGSLGCDVVVSDRVDGWAGTRDVVQPRALWHAPAQPTASSETAGGVLMQTSGSSGRPKIVRLREDQLVSVADAVAANLRLRAEDRGYNALPLFHINGQVVGVLATLVAHATLVLDRRFHRSGFWALMDERKVTWINAVPAILGILAAEQPAPPRSLRLIRSASAPLPRAVRSAIEDAVGVPVVESYGMTEAGSQITAGAADGSTPAGSVGTPAGTEVQVRATGPDGTGRIWIRGPGVITSYEDGRAADRFNDGWLDSGDDGWFGDGGELYIAGRSDDQINRGGELIYPIEVEDVLRADDRVADVAVVGRPHETLGAVPVAFVLARDGDTAGLVDALTRLAERELSRFKRPAEIRLVDDLPRAATGKVKRSAVLGAVDSPPTSAGMS